MSVDDIPEGLRLLLDAVHLLAQPFFIPHCVFGQEGPLEGQSQMSTSNADARRFSTGDMA